MHSPRILEYQPTKKTVLCLALIWIACTCAASAQNPKITRISKIAAQKFQTITITGSGFGTQNAYTGDSDFISLLDTTAGWQAGYEGCLLGFCTTDTVTLVVNEWTDTKITLGGFSGEYGQNNFFLTIGDNEQISIFNPQTSAGPATVNITVGAVPTTIKLTSAPNPSNTGQAVKFTATVDSSGGPPPDGETVSFMQGTKKIGSGTLKSGTAVFTTSKLPQGSHAITAVYAGDANFDSSTSNIVKQVVQ
ncbi:MAG: Ig-like domain-containing protein [Candidatus Sulfotelmatobacter sp.]